MSLRSFGYFISFSPEERSNIYSCSCCRNLFFSFPFYSFPFPFLSFYLFFFFHVVWFPFLLLLSLCLASNYIFQLILFHPCFFFFSFNFKLKVFENNSCEVSRSCFLSVASNFFYPRGTNSKATSNILLFCFWLKTPSITGGGVGEGEESIFLSDHFSLYEGFCFFISSG